MANSLQIHMHSTSITATTLHQVLSLSSNWPALLALLLIQAPFSKAFRHVRCARQGMPALKVLVREAALLILLGASQVTPARKNLTKAHCIHASILAQRVNSQRSVMCQGPALIVAMAIGALKDPTVSGSAPLATIAQPESKHRAPRERSDWLRKVG